MSVLTVAETNGLKLFEEENCKAVGDALSDKYRNASPFPHIVIDDFIDPDLLRKVIAEFPSREGVGFFDRDQERFKYQFHPNICDGPTTKQLFAELNGQAFLTFLEHLTGITGLISDPYFAGGGLHETRRGGHLGVHADFNVHKRMKLVRRINVLIYLNEDWSEDFGGKLELWDRSMKACEVSVSPMFGRCVIFNTDLDSYHGHPDPLQCPDDRTRRSIATYYYTSPEDGLASVPSRTTNFKARPNKGEKRDMRVALAHLVDDWMPPAIRRALGKKGK